MQPLDKICPLCKRGGLETWSDDEMYSELGRRRSRKRRTFAGGRNGGAPVKLIKCPHCGEDYPTAYLRATHKPQCAKNPRKRKESK
jgi:hypothetical protein